MRLARLTKYDTILFPEYYESDGDADGDVDADDLDADDDPAIDSHLSAYDDPAVDSHLSADDDLDADDDPAVDNHLSADDDPAIVDDDNIKCKFLKIYLFIYLKILTHCARVT